MIFHTKKPHIVSEILESDFQIDPILSKASRALFQLDTDSQKIIGTLAKHGAINENRIAKLNPNSSLNRYVVRRRTIGIESPQKSLKNTGFIFKSKGSKNNTGTVENLYSLTLKGLLASFSKAKFEDNYLITGYSAIFTNRFSKHLEFSSLILQLIKYNIGLFLLWHQINGLTLTSNLRINNYFLDWNQSNVNLNVNYTSVFSNNDELDYEFESIKIRFFVLESIVDILLQKYNIKKINFEWNYDILTRFPVKKTSTPYFDFVKFWPYYLDKLQFEYFDLYDPKKLLVDVFDETDAKITQADIEKLKKKMYSKLKIKNTTPISKQKLIW